MKKTVTLVVAVGMCMLLGGIAFAGDLGMCTYNKQVNQAKSDTGEVEQKVASKSASETTADKLFVVQADKMQKDRAAKKQ